MVIKVDADLEAALKDAASQKGLPAEVLAIDALRDRFLAATPPKMNDEWERRLLQVATDCGISLSHDAVSSEGLYE